MYVAKFQQDKNLRELVNRLFEFEKPGPARAEIGKQLAAANPDLHLKGRTLTDRIPEGTLIAVPDIEGALPTPDAARADDAAAAVLLTKLEVQIRRLGPDLAAARHRSILETQQTIDLLDSPVLREAANADPNLAERFDRLREEAAAALDRVNASGAAEQNALGRAHKTIAGLLGNLQKPNQ